MKKYSTLQVTSQIEELKISQMEKKLELKEASTRRKILALKQQLLAGRNATAPSRLQADTILESLSQSQSQQVAKSPIQAAKNHLYQPSSAGAASSQTTRTTTSYSTPTSQVQYNPENPVSHTWTNKSKNTLFLSSEIDVSKTAHTDVSSPKPANLSKHALKSETTKHSLHTPCNANESPTVQSPPVKLTLPEEVKETQYMTAVQRQKARVSKIRRCIVAATLIQRAWRRTHIRLKT